MTDREQRLQRLVNALWQIFTNEPAELARQFGESRVRCDSDRINYALELMEAHVKTGVGADD